MTVPFPPTSSPSGAEPRPADGRPVSVVERGLVAGAIAGAAVTGVLVGIGRRAGTPWRPLNALAHSLVGARADQVWDAAVDVTPMGGVVVLVVSMVAGLAAARLAASNRWSHAVVAGTGVALAGYLLHLHVVSREPGGLAALLSYGELRAIYLVAAIGLIGGMRLALYRGSGAPGR